MPAKLPHSVYILRSEADNQLYAGFSTDLTQRLTPCRLLRLLPYCVMPALW